MPKSNRNNHSKTPFSEEPAKPDENGHSTHCPSSEEIWGPGGYTEQIRKGWTEADYYRRSVDKRYLKHQSGEGAYEIPTNVSLGN